MTYRWVDHTSELELVIDAPTECGVFADAFDAFVELTTSGLWGHEDERTVESRALDVRAFERDALLADWLEELIYLADAQRFVPARIEGLRLERAQVCATVYGRTGEPSTLVKAVTRHRLAFEQGDDGEFHARLVLDV